MCQIGDLLNRSLMTSKSSPSPFEVGTRLPIFTTMRLTPATKVLSRDGFDWITLLWGLMLCRFHPKCADAFTGHGRNGDDPQARRGRCWSKRSQDLFRCRGHPFSSPPPLAAFPPIGLVGQKFAVDCVKAKQRVVLAGRRHIYQMNQQLCPLNVF